MLCSPLGSHTQSTTSSSKCTLAGANNSHHVKDCHNGTTTVAMAPSFYNLRHTRPNNRKEPLIHKGPTPKKKCEGINARRPPAPVQRVNRAHRWFALDAKMSAIYRPQRYSSCRKSSLCIVRSSMMSFELVRHGVLLPRNPFHQYDDPKF